MLWQFGGVLFLSFWVFFHKKVKKICSFLIFYLPLFLSAPCSPSTAISPYEYGERNKELQEKKKEFPGIWVFHLLKRLEQSSIKVRENRPLF